MQGCVKTWQQWAKYWKDKKGAIKRKASQMRIARQQTGGGAAEEMSLSVIEKRILVVMGGERFAVGDRNPEVNSVHQSTTESQPMTDDKTGINLIMQKTDHTTTHTICLKKDSRNWDQCQDKYHSTCDFSTQTESYLEFSESSTQTYTNAEYNIKTIDLANKAFGLFIGQELANVPVLKRHLAMYQIIKIIENNS